MPFSEKLYFFFIVRRVFSHIRVLNLFTFVFKILLRLIMSFIYSYFDIPLKLACPKKIEANIKSKFILEQTEFKLNINL